MFKYYIGIISLLLLLACQKQSTLSSPNTISQNQPPIHNIPLITNIAVEKHNSLRQKHFSNSNLTYSLKLEATAQKYANILASQGTFLHDCNNLANKYGENLYRSSGTSKPDYNNIIQKWYDEQKYYDHDSNECEQGRVCGHHTQVVWKNSRELGCASAKYTTGSFTNGYVTVCKYYPYGNIVGHKPY